MQKLDRICLKLGLKPGDRVAEIGSGWGGFERYIFPGSELASVQAILTSVKNHTRLGLSHAENIGVHYALTLRAWRARFLARLDEVRALGYDDRFIRMWDLYLAYCEAAFAERHIGNVQLVMTKAGVSGGLFAEPTTTPDRLREPARLAATVH